MSQGTGTGIVFDTDGRILTNWHVVEDALTIQVTLADGTTVDADLYRGDPDNDIALITIAPIQSLSPPQFGNSSQLEVGDRVVAIGYALALEGPPTVSTGIVSALGRVLPNEVGGVLSGLIQTDAAINNGNSGGPLINGRGEVVGVNTAKLSSGDRIGFAINIGNALAAADALTDLGPVPPPGFLGIAGRTLTQAEAANLGLPITGGYLVQAVGAGTPADDATLISGDIIVQMNSVQILGEFDFLAFLLDNPAETEVRIFAWRFVSGSGWQPIAVDAVLSERPQ